MSDSETQMVVDDAHLKKDTNSCAPESEENEVQSTDSSMEGTGKLHTILPLKNFMDVEPSVKQSVLSEETFSASSSRKCGSVLNVAEFEEFSRKMDVVNTLLKLQQMVDIGKKVRPKRNMPPSEESEVIDESPLKKFKHEADRKITSSAHRRFLINSPGDDSPPSCNLSESVSVENHDGQPTNLFECVEQNEGVSTYQAIKLISDMSKPKQKIPELHVQKEEFLAREVDTLTFLYEKIFKFDQNISENSPLYVESLAATYPPEQFCSPGALSELVKFEEILFQVINTLKNGRQEQDNAAHIFRRVVKDIKDYMQNKVENLSDFSIDDLKESGEFVDIEEIRKALPILWRALKLNMVSLKKWTSSLLDLCLQDHPNASSQQFSNCEFGINKLHNYICSIRKHADDLINGWIYTSDYPEFYDFSYLTYLASTAVSMHNTLEHELCLFKFSDLSTSGD